ncbi:MAG: hypothetical protein GEU74_01660 [Nitriliruptorales bacterium]|nr:hypothetical protein [Nitriliruptorales bacterium]
MHDAVLTVLLADPRISTGIVTARRDDDGLQRVSVDRSRVTAAASPYHGGVAGDLVALGLLKASDARALAGVARTVDAVTPPPPHGGSGSGRQHPPTRVLYPTAAAPEPAVAVLVAGLVASGAAVSSVSLRGLFFQRVASQEQVVAALRTMAAVDEDKALLDATVKEQDGFFTTFFVSPYSRYIARWSARRGLTPNQVTAASMLLGIIAAGAFAVGSRPGLIVGAVLLQLAFTTDCVDGQLARYTRQFSAVGAWLDSVFDRAKEYLVYAGLAAGAVRAGDEGGVWLLAAAALALQTVRHTVDFAFAEARPVPADPAAAGGMRRSDAAAPPGRPGPAAHIGRLGVRASVYFEHRPAMKWLKRIVVLPIGERFALISLTAAVAGPRTTFTALLVWGALAMTYTATGRILRALVA